MKPANSRAGMFLKESFLSISPPAPTANVFNLSPVPRRDRKRRLDPPVLAQSRRWSLRGPRPPLCAGAGPHCRLVPGGGSKGVHRVPVLAQQRTQHTQHWTLSAHHNPSTAHLSTLNPGSLHESSVWAGWGTCSFAKGPWSLRSLIPTPPPPNRSTFLQTNNCLKAELRLGQNTRHVNRAGRDSP